MLMIPQTALGASQLGKYVYVVGADNKADLRQVVARPGQRATHRGAGGASPRAIR